MCLELVLCCVLRSCGGVQLAQPGGRDPEIALTCPLLCRITSAPDASLVLLRSFQKRPGNTAQVHTGRTRPLGVRTGLWPGHGLLHRMLVQFWGRQSLDGPRWVGWGG